MIAALGLGGYSTGALVFIAACAFIAGLARGFSGFGAALIFVPLASTVVPPQIAAPLLLAVDIVMAAPLIPNAVRLADKRDVGIMILGTLFGVPLGAWVLAHTDATAIRWAIIAMIVPLLALLVSGWRYRGKPKPPLTIGVGWIAGFLSGLAQVGGPPIIVYWLGGEGKSIGVRANIVLYFAVSTLITLVSYVIGGILTTAVIGLALVIAPVYGVALFLGSHMFGIADEAVFRRVCYALIAAAAIFCLPVLDGVIR
jgi:uncharacterized protein